ncbi:uncharacterized protein LOC131631815 isoform X2 [Vicia villosa]|uniref:uncharacterized protein LOC131631815 isoform X2 n=1 Tax=Vicia villosa TaxID=3911 RepID=UPI00273BFA71|nr:uncharacterized protein LOC131631815 isoform X2 [Vicia villosa]
MDLFGDGSIQKLDVQKHLKNLNRPPVKSIKLQPIVKEPFTAVEPSPTAAMAIRDGGIKYSSINGVKMYTIASQQSSLASWVPTKQQSHHPVKTLSRIFYGDNMIESKVLSRIVNKHHF